MTNHDIATAVMAHARDNYSSGWDSIVECYSIDELTEYVSELGVHDVPDAIQMIAEGLDLRAEVGNDVRASGDNDFRQTERAAR